MGTRYGCPLLHYCPRCPNLNRTTPGAVVNGTAVVDPSLVETPQGMLLVAVAVAAGAAPDGSLTCAAAEGLVVRGPHGRTVTVMTGCAGRGVNTSVPVWAWEKACTLGGVIRRRTAAALRSLCHFAALASLAGFPEPRGWALVKKGSLGSQHLHRAWNGVLGLGLVTRCFGRPRLESSVPIGSGRSSGTGVSPRPA